MIDLSSINMSNDTKMNEVEFKRQNEGLDAAFALSVKGDLDGSEKILSSLGNNDPRVRFNLGWHNMRRGNLFKGYEGLNSGRIFDGFGGAKNPYGTLYNGQSLKDKTLLFHGEGGLGDEIINVRFVKDFHERGAKVLLGCNKELYPIFKNIPYVSAILDRNVCVHSHYDYWVQAMSAPYALKYEYNDLSGKPYLNYFSPKYLPNKHNKIKVGLRWAGSPKFEHEQHRRFPTKHMLELTELKQFSFYSLQRDDDLLDTGQFIDLRYEMKTWRDTAEIISGLDLIITSCTSVAHLSAAMGKPTWIIVPTLSYYMWVLPGNKSPWYDSVTLYRQTEYNNWNAPFEQLKKDLSNYKV